MFDIYIKNFNQNGSLITQETLVQSVPAANEGELKLISPLPKAEMGKAESFDFSIESGTKYYDAFLQMKTYIRIVYDGDTIFYGRVLMVDNSGFRGTRKIRCEGPFSFLLDSPVEGIPEAQRATRSVFEYMTQLIDSHNACVSSQDKKFRLGEVPGNYSQNVSEEQKIVNTSRKYGSDSWTDTKSALEDLRSHYGGYYRVRYDDVNDEIILDWMNHYFNSTVNDQRIEVGKNILDINTSTEIDNVFTVILPIGKSTGTVTSNKSGTKSTGLYLTGYKATDLSGNEFIFSSNFFNVPDITKFYTDAQLNSGYHKAEYYRNAIDKYGIIVKTVSFDDATTKEKLFNDAKEWIKNNYQGEVTKFTIKAVDMHQIGNNVSKISVGDQVNIVYPVGAEDGSFTNRSIVLTCLAINYDLYHPENNQYTFGIPANILTKTYGVSKQGKSVSGGIYNTKPDPDPDPTPEEQALDRIWNWLQHHMIHYNGVKPYQEGFPGQRRGTYGTWLLESGGDYLFASTSLRLVKCARTRTSFDPKVDKAFIGPGGESCFPWGTQVEERWQEPVPTEIGSTLTLNIIQKFNVFEYVLHEYGVDLWTLSGVKPDSIVTDEEGKITGFQLVEDETTHQKNYVKSMFYDPEARVMGFFGPNGQEVRAILAEDGNYRYWYETSPGSGEFKETNIRDLHIKAIDTDRKVGWIVEENGQGDLQFANPGEMTLAIEGHADGELVVSRVAGELMYLGNTKTQRIMTTSVEHMDQVTGDVEYVADETDPSLKIFKINSGGGMRVNHGKKVLKTGPDGKPLDPNDPANWEYETITDPDTGEKKIVTADFGVYDNNNLVGGILSEKLNDGTVKTLIRGDVVDIKASQMASIGIYTDDHYDAGFIVNRINNGNQKINGTNINITSDQILISDAAGSDTLKSWMDGTDEDIGEVTGSAIWRNRDQVTNVAGKFKFEQNPDGTTRMVIVSGGGLNIEKNNVQYGIYDSQTLTGGVMVNKLNDGTVTTTINGNALVFGDANTVTAEVTATELARFGLVDTNGQFTGGLVASKLNDGTVTTTINGNALVFGDANTVTAEVTATELARFGLVDANGQFTGGLIANKLNDGTVTTNISGSIVNLQANSSFSAIISGSGANAAIKPAAIQAAIDSATGASKITLSADNVILDGDTTLHGAMSIDGSGQLLVSRVIGIGSTGNQTFINGNKIMSKDYQIVSGGKIIFVGSGTGEHYDIDVSTVSNMIKSVSVSNNVLTITPFYGDPINFSKATSLSGAWSGGTYTVTAKQRNKNTATGQTVDTTVATWSYSPGLRLNGNESDNFSAEITDTTGSTTIAVKSTYGYLAVAGSGASSSVKVYTNRSGSAGSYSYSNPVASLGVGSLYTNGVTAGKNAVTINKGSWSGGVISFTKSEGTASTKQVQLTAASATWNGNTASVKIWDGTAADTSHGVDTGYTVSVNATDRYNAGVTAGKNAVTINKGSWSGGVISFTKSEGTASTKKVQLTAASASWSGNTASVKIWDGTAADTSHGVDTGYTVTVDASGRYTAGHTAGVTDGKNAVTINKGSWSGGVISFTKSEGTASTKKVQLTAASASWSGNTASVKIWDGTAADTSHGVDTGYTVTVDASGRYNAGTYAGKAAVTLNDPTWNAITGTTPTYRTITVSTSGRTNASGTTENLSKSAALYLTQGSWSSNNLTVSLRHGSTTGTVVAQTTVNASGRYTAGVNSVTVSNVTQRATREIYYDSGWKAKVYTTGTASNGATKNVDLVADIQWLASEIYNEYQIDGYTVTGRDFVWNDKWYCNVNFQTQLHLGETKNGSLTVDVQELATNSYLQGYDDGYAAGSGGSVSISVESQQIYVDGQGTAPWGSSGVTPLNTMSRLVKNNKNTTGIYFVFKVVAGGSTKWYRFTSI